MSLVFCTATTDEELAQILALQKANHSSTLSEADAARDGFVTVMHSLDLLNKMNNAAPQIIAKDGQTVIAYALVMLKSFSAMIPKILHLDFEYKFKPFLFQLNRASPL